MVYEYDTLRHAEVDPGQPGLEYVVDRQSDKYIATSVRRSLSTPPTATSTFTSPRPKTLYGLSPFVAGLSTGLIIAIVLCAAVGGGLGSSLAHCQHRLTHSSMSSNSNSTSSTSNTNASTTPSLDNYSVADYKSVNKLYNDCPSLANTEPQTLWGDLFIPECNRDYGNGRSATGGGVVSDIIGVISYSFMDCMNACSAFNAKSKLWGVNSTCQAISFDLDLANTTSANGANCWLKNATLSVGLQPYLANLVMSAKLAT